MKSVGITVVLLILLVAGGIFLFTRGGVPETSVSTGRVPDLVFEDYGGREVALASFDKPVVVNSWASWCPFCVDELPAFQNVQEEFGDRVQVIAVNRAESLSTARRYTDNLNVTDGMLFVLDPDDRFYRAIGGFSMPETLFVRADGSIQEHKRGPMEEEEIRRNVEALLQ